MKNKSSIIKAFFLISPWLCRFSRSGDFINLTRVITIPLDGLPPTTTQNNSSCLKVGAYNAYLLPIDFHRGRETSRTSMKITDKCYLSLGLSLFVVKSLLEKKKK